MVRKKGHKAVFYKKKINLYIYIYMLLGYKTAVNVL